MYELANLPKHELDAIFQEASNIKGLIKAIIEKSFWVCVVLDYLFTKSPRKDSLAFRVGTSLSKARNLIKRFSEDIDLILNWRVLGYSGAESLTERSSNHQDKLNKEIFVKTSEFLQKVFIPKIKEVLPKLTNRDLQIIFKDDVVAVGYDNEYADKTILHTIRLEIGSLTAWAPTQTAIVRPYIAETCRERFSNVSVNVRAIEPEHTFWEKIAILHREVFRSENSSFPLRMSRHYYGIRYMTKLGALNRVPQNPSLLNQVAEFKAKFYPQKWAHDELAKLGTLRLTLPDYDMTLLQRDYAHGRNDLWRKAYVH